MKSISNVKVNQYAGSSSNSIGNVRSRVVGFPTPKICWCGHSVVELKSKSSRNPGRMHYRCSYATDNRLHNDGHIFKWVDEVYVDLKAKIFEEEWVEMKRDITESIEFERKKLEQMEIEVEGRLTERIEVAISEANRAIWKALCMVILVGLVFMGVIAKLFD